MKIELNMWYDEKNNRDFKKEINWIASVLNIPTKRIRIDGEHPCGEDCIFIDDKWNGYLDNSFYQFMENGFDPYGDFEEWINNFKTY